MLEPKTPKTFDQSAAKHGYATAPVKSTRMPPGIPYIIGNEGAERFSFYGMKAILVVFMTKYMMTANGQPDHLPDAQAKEYYHYFVSAVYFLPLLGSIISDAFLGKYRTIIFLSLVYCAGHLALALDATRAGLFLGLTLISFGAGGIKPCVSAHVGDQFGSSNQHLLPRIFSWFYFSINFGSAISTLWIPYILKKHGPHYAFAVPGILMLLATWVFWLGRKKFVHIPPGGMEFVKESFRSESLKIISRLFVLYAFVAMFWVLFDQTSAAWVLQADKMDRHALGSEWDAAQLQAINPILILIFIPIFSYIIYPAINKIFPLTPLRKIAIGFFMAVPSFIIPAWVEMEIARGAHPNIIWQFIAYCLITAAEVLVSITCLEFSYTQAPKKMKSLVMGFFLASVTLGNLFTAAVNHFIQNPDHSTKPEWVGANYYLFFAGLMLVTAIVFVFVAGKFKVQTFIQDEIPAAV